MTVGLSTTNLANNLLNTLRGSSFSNAATYVALHTDGGDPGSAGTANASAGSTTRSAVTFSAASGGSIALTGTQPTWTNGGSTENIKYISVWSASTGGNLLWTAQLSSTKSWASGDTLTLTSCSLSLAPLAA